MAAAVRARARFHHAEATNALSSATLQERALAPGDYVPLLSREKTHILLRLPSTSALENSRIFTLYTRLSTHLLFNNEEYSREIISGCKYALSSCSHSHTLYVRRSETLASALSDEDQLGERASGGVRESGRPPGICARSLCLRTHTYITIAILYSARICQERCGGERRTLLCTRQKKAREWREWGETRPYVANACALWRFFDIRLWGTQERISLSRCVYCVQRSMYARRRN